eukprot:2940226-Lingulodinium_polyedra.AAC.1
MVGAQFRRQCGRFARGLPDDSAGRGDAGAAARAAQAAEPPPGPVQQGQGTESGPGAQHGIVA